MKKWNWDDHRVFAEGMLLAVIIMGPFVAMGVLLILTVIDSIKGLL